MFLAKLQLKFRFQELKSVPLAFVFITLIALLSGCGLISPKPIQTSEPESVSSDAQVKASIDVAAINQNPDHVQEDFERNIALRLLSVESDSQTLNKEHGYYWLDGVVTRLYRSDGGQTGAVERLELESIYDAETYIVTAQADLLNGFVEGQHAYFDGFYDNFSGFYALRSRDVAEMLEHSIDRFSLTEATHQSYDFGKVVKFNKRKQTITTAKNQDFILDKQTNFFDAYAKQELTKNAFWRALSEDDTVFTKSKKSEDGTQVSTVWLIDKQVQQNALVGVIKASDSSKTDLVLSTEMWTLNSSGKARSQSAEVSLKLSRKSQIFSYGEEQSQSILKSGQMIVVEGKQKNHILEVENLYLKEKQQLPVYAFGVVNAYHQGNKTVDLTLEWMFGVEPSTELEVSLNALTEISEIEDETELSSEEFWHLLSLNDTIEVEGQMFGDSLYASRLLLRNKQIEQQSFSGTVSSIENGRVLLRLYNYIEDAPSFSLDAENSTLFALSQGVIEIELLDNVEIQEMHGSESIIADEFLRRLEAKDQITVSGYFDNDVFIAKHIEFEDKKTTPFIFGEIEAVNVAKRHLTLKGQDLAVLLTEETIVEHPMLDNVSIENIWNELRIGDSIDAEGSYENSNFIASKVFLNPKSFGPTHVPEKKENFNFFDWLIN